MPKDVFVFIAKFISHNNRSFASLKNFAKPLGP